MQSALSWSVLDYSLAEFEPIAGLQLMWRRRLSIAGRPGKVASKNGVPGPRVRGLLHCAFMMVPLHFYDTPAGSGCGVGLLVIASQGFRAAPGSSCVPVHGVGV
jgi:hypothetical protein